MNLPTPYSFSTGLTSFTVRKIDTVILNQLIMSMHRSDDLFYKIFMTTLNQNTLVSSNHVELSFFLYIKSAYLDETIAFIKMEAVIDKKELVDEKDILEICCHSHECLVKKANEKKVVDMNGNIVKYPSFLFGEIQFNQLFGSNGSIVVYDRNRG